MNPKALPRQGRVLLMLVRREFWEHRVLVLAPTVLSVIFLVLCILASARVPGGWLVFDGRNVDPSHGLPPQFAVFMHILFTTLLYLLMAVVAFFYLADCLYSERKDRSILFWKSLPVSDTMTVVAKLFVALVAVPLVVYGLSVATNLIASAVFRVSFGLHDTPVQTNWTWLHWLELNGILFVDIFVLALWFAPVASYQLLVSVWAKRAALVWTVLPPVALVLGQKMLFNSWSIWEFLSYRLGGVMFGRGSGNLVGPEAAFRGVNAIPLLTQPDLWFGVAVAAILLYATIRIRRHSDDT